AATRDRHLPRSSSKSRARRVRMLRPRVCPLWNLRIRCPISIQSRREKVPQHQTRPQQTRLDGTRRYTKRLGRVLDAHMLHISQNERLPVFLCELAQRSDKLLADFLALQSFRLNLAPVGEVAGRVRAVLVFLVRDGSHDFEMTLSLPLPRFV